MLRRWFLSLGGLFPLAVLAKSTPKVERGSRYVQIVARWMPVGECDLSGPIYSLDAFKTAILTIGRHAQIESRCLEGEYSRPIEWRVSWGNGSRDVVRFSTRFVRGSSGNSYMAWDGKDDGLSFWAADEFQAIQGFLPDAVFQVLEHGKV